MRRAAFLDRDGVLNKPILQCGGVRSPRRLEEFELLPGTARAVATLRRAGLLVIVVTNQPDVARGLLEPAELERIHRRCREVAAVDAIYACCHDDPESCLCRKPKPGLLLQAARDWGIALTASYLVGDSWKDIEAGAAAGCRTLLVDSLVPQTRDVRPSYRVRNLQVAAEVIAALCRSTISTHPFQ